ncbi:MAG: hypothetical protein Q8N06_04490 [Hydrogenophaga sp.]|nr:hypothetical protein [Hydrogenophaga sp.]
MSSTSHSRATHLTREDALQLLAVRNHLGRGNLDAAVFALEAFADPAMTKTNGWTWIEAVAGGGAELFAPADGQVARPSVPSACSCSVADHGEPASEAGQAQDLGVQLVRRDLQEVWAGFDDLPLVGPPQSGPRQPFARIRWSQDDGDRAVGLQGVAGWTLGEEQRGTLLHDIMEKANLATST